MKDAIGNHGSSLVGQSTNEKQRSEGCPILFSFFWLSFPLHLNMHVHHFVEAVRSLAFVRVSRSRHVVVALHGILDEMCALGDSLP